MSAKQSPESSGSSAPKENDEDDIITQILKRINNLKDTKYSTDVNYYVPKLIVGFVSMVLLLLTYQVNATSSYIGSGLGVPSHNVGIYVAKLTSYRSFLMMIGFGFAYLIYYICTLVSEDEKVISLTLKIISLFFFYFLLASRACLLFSSFLTNNLSYRVYILLSIEAIPAGLCQMSLFLLVPQFIFITFLSIHLLAFIFFLSQFAFDLFLYNKPLAMIKIQFFMSLFVTIIAFGLWAFYLFYYYDDEPKSYKKELYKQSNNIKRANSIYGRLKELANKAKGIFDKITTLLKDGDYLLDLTKEVSELKSIITEILTLNNDFFILFKDCVNYINKCKDNLVKLSNEINETSNSDKKKSENKLHTQKSKYYNDKFVQKVNKLKNLFDESYKKYNLKDLSTTLTNRESEINVTLKVYNNGGNENTFESIYEIQKNIKKVYDETSNIHFNLHDPSRNTHTVDQISGIDKKAEESLDDKIKFLRKPIDGYYNKIVEFESEIKNIVELENSVIKTLFDESTNLLFCYVMIAVACFFRDFLYPSIIPLALLIEYEAQKILLLGIILQLFFCFPVFILDDFLNIFSLLIEKYFIYFWTLAGPPFIVLIFTFLAIHTKIRFFHVITESTGRVFTLSLFLIPFYTLMESVSYACLLHYVFYQLGFSDQNLLFLLFHQLIEMFCTYFFSKLSAGYNHARVRLGHCLPTYTTNYEMTFCQEFWSMVKWTVKYTFKDILFFFSTNIRQYL